MNGLEVREPAVAGKFYPSSAKEINTQIGAFADTKAVKSDCFACILPHAGYIYSGEVAVKTLSRVNIKEKIILIGPNHTGYGFPFSIMAKGIWQTPVGGVKIDSLLAEKILSRSKNLKNDHMAHIYEHSLEVELPIIKYFKSNFEIVPLILASGGVALFKELGEDIAAVIKESNLGKNILLIASSDMTHYEPQDEAEKKDRLAIDAILELNEDKLMERISRFDITMCGYAPVITMLSAAKSLGAKAAELVKYQTSGDVTGDKDSVVGYAGIIVH